MSASLNAALAFVLKAEGPDSNNPNDPGGLTRFGISQNNHPDVDVAALTLDDATQIYSDKYWSPICGDKLAPSVALVVFDAAVNQGVHAASVMLQQAVGVAQDGVVGPITVAAVNKRDPLALAQEVCARRAVRYAGGNMKEFGLGWMRRVFAALLDAAGQMPTLIT